MPCFSSGVGYATTCLKQRFQLQLSEQEAEVFVDDHLINKSLGSYYTRGTYSPLPILSSVDMRLIHEYCNSI